MLRKMIKRVVMIYSHVTTSYYKFMVVSNNIRLRNIEITFKVG
jgi:hypothetical protein